MISLYQAETAPEKDSTSSNYESIYFLRTIGTILGGCMAGLLGIREVGGFAFYLFTSAIVSFVLLLKSSFKPKRYYQAPITEVVFSGIFARDIILTYLLFWTMAYSFYSENSST